MKKVNIGIIGLGTIGSGVYKILKQRRNRIRQLYKIDIQVLKCCDISDSTKRKLKIPSSNFTKDFKSIIQDERIDTVIELIGGTSVAYSISKEVLKSGKNLITANKALLAKYGDTLESLAGKHKKNIGYEASVGGGIPLINTIENSLLINEINSFQGIMNGTCNYILSLMANGTEFKAALKSAQDEGFAEADPKLDINGQDTAHKVAVLCKTCFGLNINLKDVFTAGIEKITSYDLECASNLGYKIKLLGIGRITNNYIDARVHPTLIENNNPLANVDNEFNAILINSKNLGPVMNYGYGAGMLPTASAVVSDIIKISNSNLELVINKKNTAKIHSMQRLERKFYLRIDLEDKSGNLGKITSMLGKSKISIEKIIQDNVRVSRKKVPVIIFIKKTKFQNINRALEKIRKLKFVSGRPLLIPVEDIS